MTEFTTPAAVPARGHDPHAASTPPPDRRCNGSTRRSLLLSGLSLWSLWHCPRAFATGQPAADGKGLASHLHRLLAYIEWPGTAFPDPAAPIVVGVMGSPDVFEALARAVAGRTVQGRPVEVRLLAVHEGAAQPLHLLHVGAAAWVARAHARAASGERPPVLTTDAAGGVDQGAAIGFALSGAGVRMEASLPAADAAGVRISSRLLAVVDRVVERPK